MPYKDLAERLVSVPKPFRAGNCIRVDRREPVTYAGSVAFPVSTITIYPEDLFLDG